MKHQFDEAWRALVEHDLQLEAPPHLEAAVMAAIKHQHSTAPATASRLPASAWLAAAATVAAAAAAIAMLRGAPPRVQLLNAAAHPAVRLVPSVPMDSPGAGQPAAARRRNAPAGGRANRSVVMMVENTPALLSEPLQLVRLRVPKEALLGLGLSLVEPDASGTVDVDVLVGEDGLPRNIRHVRVIQEER
jgi:hypothetical protein